MRLEHDTLSLWYGTVDAPCPMGTVARDADLTVTVGISPPDASNEVDVLYRVNGGAAHRVAASWLRRDQSNSAEYFRAVFPPLTESDRVEFCAVASCAGRYVPSPGEADITATSFAVRGVPDNTRKGRAMANTTPDPSAPLVRLDPGDGANAPVLSYNVPDPTSHPGRSYITLQFGANDPFHVNAMVTPEGRVLGPGISTTHSDVNA